MAAVAHQFGLGLIGLVAVLAVDLAHVVVMGVGLEVGRLLSEIFVRNVALQALVLRDKAVFGLRPHALMLLSEGLFSSSGGTGSKRKAHAESQSGDKTLFHFVFLPVIGYFLAAFLARLAISTPATRPNTVAAPSCAPPA